MVSEAPFSSPFAAPAPAPITSSSHSAFRVVIARVTCEEEQGGTSEVLREFEFLDASVDV
jgi:hypothetical protein